MSWAVVIQPFWCRSCRQRPVAYLDDYCPGCSGDVDQLLDPITRWPRTTPRPSRWQRVWARLERRRSA